jgi:hypothetical protein
MHFIIYISTSIKLMGQDELAQILVTSRKNNSASGITGMLMYSQGTFIQVLEGSEHALKHTFDIIEEDKRHRNIVVLASGENKERVFAGWSMAFLMLATGKMEQLEGYINPAKNKLFEEADRNVIINILKTFAENNNLT